MPDVAVLGITQVADTPQLPQSTKPVEESVMQFGCF